MKYPLTREACAQVILLLRKSITYVGDSGAGRCLINQIKPTKGERND